MARSFDLINTALGGTLSQRLIAWRAEGLSMDEITARLAADGFKVSDETVRRWCKQAGIPTGRVPAPMPTQAAS